MQTNLRTAELTGSMVALPVERPQSNARLKPTSGVVAGSATQWLAAYPSAFRTPAMETVVWLVLSLSSLAALVISLWL